MKISKRAVDFIIAKEVISPAYYTKHFQNPIWPKGESGITIGIGYDLGYASRADIVSDWSMLSADDIKKLQSVAGVRGAKSIARLKDVSSVSVPIEIAKEVFIKSSLPKYAKSALRIYPGLDKLLPDAIGGIVSMIYNRGASLEGARRVHMKKIVPLVAALDYTGIAEQIEESKKLWEGKNLDGLITRREQEAEFVRKAIRDYTTDETIELF